MLLNGYARSLSISGRRGSIFRMPWWRMLRRLLGGSQRCRICRGCWNAVGPRLRRCGRRYGRDEAVAPTGDGLDVGRLRRIVAERLSELGDCLRERVVRDGDVRPECLEQIILRDERRWSGHQIQEQVDDLRRELDNLVITQQAVRRRVEDVRSESVGHKR